VYDSNGNVVGASGKLLKIGNTYYVDPSNNTIKPITEPISAFIGGIPRQFTVAGVTYPTGIQGQDYLAPLLGGPLPQNVMQCNNNPSAPDCIAGESWNTHAFGHIHDRRTDKSRSANSTPPS
jgi:hypothetical protein